MAHRVRKLDGSGWIYFGTKAKLDEFIEKNPEYISPEEIAEAPQIISKELYDQYVNKTSVGQHTKTGIRYSVAEVFPEELYPALGVTYSGQIPEKLGELGLDVTATIGEVVKKLYESERITIEGGSAEADNFQDTATDDTTADNTGSNTNDNGGDNGSV
jgi:hypothetical protein